MKHVYVGHNFAEDSDMMTSLYQNVSMLVIGELPSVAAVNAVVIVVAGNFNHFPRTSFPLRYR